MTLLALPLCPWGVAWGVGVLLERRGTADAGIERTERAPRGAEASEKRAPSPRGEKPAVVAESSMSEGVDERGSTMGSHFSIERIIVSMSYD